MPLVRLPNKATFKTDRMPGVRDFCVDQLCTVMHRGAIMGNGRVNIRLTHLYNHTQKIVRDTGGAILYNAGHDKLFPTSGYRYTPNREPGDRHHPFFTKHSPTYPGRTY